LESLTLFDGVVVIVYLLLILGVGFYGAYRREESSAGYFLGDRSMGWFAIGASLFVTNISGEHFIGLAASGADKGLVVGHFEWLAILWLMLLGWIFAPLYLKSGVFTMPEFLEKRYNTSSRMYLTGISIVAYILTKISVALFAGGLLLNALLGWDIYTSALLMIVITGVYTIVGGLSAVMYTHTLQLFFLLAGALIMTIFGLNEVGGFSGLRANLPDSYFCMFRPMSDPDFPWTGIVFGAPILGVWYWCTDQYIVQRVLSARNISHVQTATIFAGFLKILPVFLLVIPGMIAAVLFPEAKGNSVYPMLLASKILPVGLTGLVLAGLLAAIMSSLASVFNSTATLFTIDFYKYFKPKASERELVLIGRLATTIIVVTAILWVPVTKLINSQIYIYLQSMQAYISPPITAVFLIGIFSKKVNGRGAIWSLVTGGLIGATRLILELLHQSYPITNGMILWFIKINFLHFAILLFVISSVILVGVSLLTSPVRDQSPVSITDKPVFSGLKEWYHPLVHRRKNIAFSALLIIMMIGLYGYFF
jgi:SSS family solute:Na+ symporter